MPKIAPQSHLPQTDTDLQPDPVIEQARKDVERGLVDTDMWATPGLDAEQRQGMTPTDPKTDADPPQQGDRVTRPPR